MNEIPKDQMDRRAFLKWLAATGGGLVLAQFLAGCSPTATQTLPPLSPSSTSTLIPPATPTPVNGLLASLQGLELDPFLDEAYRLWMLRDPEAITLNGLSGFFSVRNDQLTDLSDAFIRQTQAMQAGVLELLEAFDESTFSPGQDLNARLYRWFLQDQQTGYKFMYSDYLVFPFVNSLLWTMNYLFTEVQPLDDEHDLADTLSRLDQVYKKMEQVVEGLNRRKENGVVLPAIIMPDAINDIQQYTRTGIAHPYYSALSSRIGSSPDLTNDQKDSWRSQVSDAIKASVSDGFQLVLDFFLKTSPIAPQEIGLLRFPQGEEYYEFLLHHYTSTDLSADEIHQIGLDNVERIKDEIRTEFSKLGYPASDSINSLVNKLGNDDGFISGKPAEDYIRQTMDDAASMLDRVFDFSLTQEIGVIGGTEGNYLSPAPRDGSRPPTFYALTDYPQAKFRLKSIIYHEAIPGHGYQDDITSQLKLPLHRFVFDYHAFLEGWALYAERLMWEMGVYDDDLAGNIGRLDMELLRAVRCVLDTGIHAKGWTFEQSRQFMLDSRGVPDEYEIRRYIMWPGQAPSYYVGYKKIMDLRQKASDALGSKFQLKDFHHVILGSSQIPLTIMEELVDSYIAHN